MRWRKRHEVNPYDSISDNSIPVDTMEIINKLSKTGIKILNYISRYSVRVDDILFVDRKKVMHECGFKMPKSISNGIADLIKNDILSKTMAESEYYFNPKFISKIRSKNDN